MSLLKKLKTCILVHTIKRNLGIRGLGEVTPCARFLDLKLSSVKR